MDAQQYYDEQRGWTKQSRRNLMTYDLRQFNNWVKDVLITKYCRQRTDKLKFSQDLQTVKLRVLEIGCGKGGDVSKWSYPTNNVNLWYGVDIAGNSLEEAKKRIQGLKNKQFYARLIREYGNSDPDIFFKNFNQDTKFDLISSQFVIHYMFDSEKSVKNLIQNMTSRLTKNGYIILTIPDAQVIVKMLKELAQKVEDNGETQYRYTNKYFGLQTKQLDFPKDKIHGVEYGFYLADAVGEKQGDKITFVPEYLIYLDEFIKLMEEQGMQVVENENFLEFYRKQRFQYFQQLLFRFNHFESPNDQIDEDQWDCIHCYRVLVFKKYKGKEQDQRQREYDIEQHREERVKYIEQSIQEKQQFFLNKEQHKKQQQNALSNNTTNLNGNGNINGTFSDSDEEETKVLVNEKQEQTYYSHQQQNQTDISKLKAEIASTLLQEKNVKLQNSQQKEKLEKQNQNNPNQNKTQQVHEISKKIQFEAINKDNPVFEKKEDILINNQSKMEIEQSQAQNQSQNNQVNQNGDIQQQQKQNQQYQQQQIIQNNTNIECDNYDDEDDETDEDEDF